MRDVPSAQQDAPDSLVATIVEAVANREGVSATELSPPLHAVIDPDALSALFAPTGRGSPRAGGRVEFEYCGYEVVVRSDGSVSVSGAEAASGAASASEVASASEAESHPDAEPQPSAALERNPSN